MEQVDGPPYDKQLKLEDERIQVHDPLRGTRYSFYHISLEQTSDTSRLVVVSTYCLVTEIGTDIQITSYISFVLCRLA